MVCITGQIIVNVPEDTGLPVCFSNFAISSDYQYIDERQGGSIMKAKIVAVLLISALALTTGVVIAQRSPGVPGRGAGPGMGRGMGPRMGGPCGMGLGLGMGPNVERELGLTSSQTTKLQDITNRYMSETQQTRTRLQTNLKELADMWTAEHPDKSAIRNKIAETDRLRAQIRDAMVNRAFDAMEVLTPEQRAKLRDMVKSRPGFGVGMGYGLGLGCGMNGGNCYMMGGPGGRGPRGPMQSPK